jgi:hypothetical protein
VVRRTFCGNFDVAGDGIMAAILKATLLATGLLAAGTASAADLPSRKDVAPPPPVFTWTGLYIGFNERRRRIHPPIWPCLGAGRERHGSRAAQWFHVRRPDRL